MRTNGWLCVWTAVVLACTPVTTLETATDAGTVDAYGLVHRPGPTTAAWTCYFCADATATTAAVAPDADSPAEVSPSADATTAATDGLDDATGTDGFDTQALDVSTADVPVVMPPPLPPPGKDPAVDCGLVSCSLPAIGCCRALPYGPGTCVGAASPCSLPIWQCDDRDDCIGMACCTIPGGGSHCLGPKECIASQGTSLCKVDSDCEPGFVCCAKDGSPAYECAKSCAP
jgi:hypothetical protein